MRYLLTALGYVAAALVEVFLWFDERRARKERIREWKR